MAKSISRWEKFKRVVAHSFELETKGEIREKHEEAMRAIRRAEMEERKARRMRELEIEYEKELVEIQRREAIRRIQQQQEEEQRLIEEEEQRKRQEAIELYKTNNWDKGFTKNTTEE